MLVSTLNALNLMERERGWEEGMEVWREGGEREGGGGGREREGKKKKNKKKLREEKIKR